MRTRLQIVLFFVRTLYLSPATNYLFAAVVVVSALLRLTGDLTKHMALVLLYTTGLTHGVLFRLSAYAAGDVPEHSFTLLPARRSLLASCVLSAGAAYALVLGAAQVILLFSTMGLPPLLDPVIAQSRAGSEPLTVLSGVVLERPLDCSICTWVRVPVQYVFSPSVIFGRVTGPAGYPGFPLWPVVLVSVVVFRCLSGAVCYFWPMLIGGSARRNLPMWTLGVLEGGYAVAGLLIIADALLPPRLLAAIRDLPSPVWIGACAVLAAMGAAVALQIMRLYDHAVLLDKGEGGHSGDL